MNLTFRDTDGYLERILMDGTKTIASDKTWLSYEWWEKYMWNQKNSAKKLKTTFLAIYQWLQNKKKILSKKQLTWLIYYLTDNCLTLKGREEDIITILEWDIFKREVFLGVKVYIKSNIIKIIYHEPYQIDHGVFDFETSIQYIFKDLENSNQQTFCIEKVLLRMYQVFFELQQYRSSTGYINASSKLVSLEQEYKEKCGEEMYLNNLYFWDIDSIDQVQLANYKTLKKAKSFQEKQVIYALCQKTIGRELSWLIDHKKIDTIIMTPNNAQRKTNVNEVILAYIRENTDLSWMNVYPYESITVNNFPERQTQKSIRWVCARMTNAEKLFDCTSITTWNNILLIDDAFGSGATMNMISKKIKKNLPHCTITGFALIGSMKQWFDVLSEV